MKSVLVQLSQIKTSGIRRGTDAEFTTLIDSMRSLGQLQEVILNSRYELIDGRRRYAAAKHLGLKNLRAFINPSFDDAIKALKAERDANGHGCRVPLTRSEQLELARRLEELENPEAAKRKAATQAKKGEGKVGGGNLPAPDEKCRVRDKVGEVVGMSGRSLEKAQAVIDAAQAEPERYLDLAEKVSQDGQPIDPVYQEFRQRQEVYDAAENDKRFGEVAEVLTNTQETSAAYAQYERIRDEQSKDRLGNPLPKRLVKVFNDRWIETCVGHIDGMLATMKEVNRAIGKHREWPYLDSEVIKCGDDVVLVLESMRDGLQEAKQHSVCTDCAGGGCKACKQAGWIPEK